MATIRKVRTHDAQSVRVTYKNPSVYTRGRKLASGTVIFQADDVRLVLHTVYGAASILRRSAVRVQQLIEKGQLKAYRLGRDWVIADPDLREFIASQRSKLLERYGAFLD